MKKLFGTLLPLLLSGCADEHYLVGRWEATDASRCLAEETVLQVPCAFHLLKTYSPEPGYRVVFSGEHSKRFSGPLEKVSYGHYVIHAPNNDYPLDLIGGKLANPWGRTFERVDSLQD